MHISASLLCAETIVEALWNDDDYSCPLDVLLRCMHAERTLSNEEERQYCELACGLGTAPMAIEARKRLLRGNLGLVAYICEKEPSASRSHAQRVQAGNRALAQCARTYRRGVGASFSIYAATSIRAAVKEEVSFVVLLGDENGAWHTQLKPRERFLVKMSMETCHDGRLDAQTVAKMFGADAEYVESVVAKAVALAK